MHPALVLGVVRFRLRPIRHDGAALAVQARPSRSELGGLKGRKPRKAVETLLRQAAKQETDQLLSDIGGRN